MASCLPANDTLSVIEIYTAIMTTASKLERKVTYPKTNIFVHVSENGLCFRNTPDYIIFPHIGLRQSPGTLNLLTTFPKPVEKFVTRLFNLEPSIPPEGSQKCSQEIARFDKSV